MTQRIVAFSNRKGGVGKTTSSLNVGAGLAKKGRKVLLVDLDPQGNLSQALFPETPGNTIFTLLTGECSVSDGIYNIQDNLSLIPCNKNFSRFEKQFSGEPESPFLLDELIESINKEQEGAYDFIILDCPPALGLITVNAFVAAKEVYIPMEAQEFALNGLTEVYQLAEAVKKRSNQDLKIKGLFFTRYNGRTNISKNMIEVLEEDYPDLLMSTHIRRNVSLEESPSLRQHIYDYAPLSNGANDYDALTNAILKAS